MSDKNALIIHPDNVVRSSLHKVVGSMDEAPKVKAMAALADARRVLNDGATFDTVFISSQFNLGDVTSLIELNNALKADKNTVFILVMAATQQNNDAVATNMMTGIHGFVCEPFTLDGLESAVSLAQGVCVQPTKTRLKAATGILLREIWQEEMIEEGAPKPVVKANPWDEVQASFKWFKDTTGQSITVSVINSLHKLSAIDRAGAYDGASNRVRSKVAKTLREKLNPFKKSK